jgi:hypothetical protein
MNTYSIIWKHFDKDTELGIRLEAKERFSLPYFIDGIEKEDFENKRPISLNPLHLIQGLLVGYFDKPPETDTAFAKFKTKTILNENLKTFKSESLESLILDIAAHLRLQNGQEASLQSLMTGVELVPESISIKYDCSLDLYNCLEDEILQDRKAGIQKLTELLEGIDTAKLDQTLLDDYKLLKSDVDDMY